LVEWEVGHVLDSSPTGDAVIKDLASVVAKLATHE